MFLCAAPVLGQDAPDPGYRISDRQTLTVEHTETSAWTAERVERMFTRAKAEVEDRLGVPLPPRPHAVVAPTDEEFARRFGALTGGRRPSKTILAVAFPGRNLIIIRQSGIREGTDAGLERTFKHELAHLALGRIERQRGQRLPRWLNEGLSEFAAGRRPTAEESSALAGWAKYLQMPRFETLTHHFPDHGNASARVYTVSMAFLVWCDGRRPVARLVEALSASADVDQAFQRTLGMSAADAEAEWKLSIAQDHSWLRALVHSVNVWGAIALLAIVAGLRAYWTRWKMHEKLIEEERQEDLAADPLDPSSPQQYGA